ncbi:hypothetical protein [Nocardia sp. CNY236]|uniref:DUF6973 domain-containing protein n=1 Tax=Nocardia sp. CNY236 TaxID=1169152 RepID=UPI000417FEBA|nr:hypothetical protein [Nocardia sp. CNY236]
MSGGAYVDALTVPIVLGWDPRPAVQIANNLADTARKLDAEAYEAAWLIGDSNPYWKGDTGNNARNRAIKDRNDARRTAQVLIDIQQEIVIQIDALVGHIDLIREKKADAEDSKFDFFVRDDGAVDSRMSNAEVLLKFGPEGLIEKEGRELLLTTAIRSALTDIQQIDKEGAEQIRRWLEELSPDVQRGSTPMPTDPELAEILTKYQTDPSESGAELWPSGLVLKGIRAVEPDFQPTFMTPEEIALLSKQLAYPDGINRLMDFFDFRSAAEEAANEVFLIPGDDRAMHDGHGDAYRHMYWNALMTQRYGEEWTRDFATAHEGIGANPPHREAMDLYNNDIGRQIAVEHPNATPAELKRLVQEKIDTGQAIVINQDKQIEWSNRVPVRQTSSPETADIPLTAER